MKPMMGRRNFRSMDGCAPSKDWITNFIRRWTRFLVFMEPYKGTSVDGSSILRAKQLIIEHGIFDDLEGDADVPEEEEGGSLGASGTVGTVGAAGTLGGRRARDAPQFAGDTQERQSTNSESEMLAPLNLEKLGRFKGVGLHESDEEGEVQPTPNKKPRVVRGSFLHLRPVRA